MNDCKIRLISELPLCSVAASNILKFSSATRPNVTINPIFLSDIDDGNVDVPPDFEDELIAKRNKRNTLIGNLGEEIAQAYLQTVYSRVRRISIVAGKSGYGYDLLADGHLCFEVKTSTAKSFEFEITFNELFIANEKRNDYYIFYIALDTGSRTASGFIFNHPVEKFGLKFDDLIKRNSIFEPRTFRGRLQGHTDLAEKVELNEFLIKILNMKPKYSEVLFEKEKGIALSS